MKRTPVKPNNISILFALTFVFLLAFSSNAFAAEDYSHNHTFQNETLKKLIGVQDDDNDYDVEEAQNMIDRVSKINERLISETQKAGVSLILTDFPVTYLPEYLYLKGVVPRGWEGTGLTWDDVPGIGGIPVTAARIGYSDYGRGHSTVNLELHELSHAIDSAAAGLDISNLEEFAKIHEEEYEPLFHDHVVFYYFAYIEEYFAEAMALYYLNEDTKAKLLERAPKTYHFIETLPQRIISIDKITSSESSFSWEPIDGAVKYEVYRDDRLLRSTKNTNYKDARFRSGQNYTYYVKAFDKKGNVLNTTFPRLISNEVQSLPENPTKLAVKTKTKVTVSLTWNQASGADYYEILRDGVVVGTSKNNSYTDNRLTPNTIYTYSVRAVNALGASVGANEIIVTTNKDPKDKNPTNINEYKGKPIHPIPNR